MNDGGLYLERGTDPALRAELGAGYPTETTVGMPEKGDLPIEDRRTS
jgi:hypothetical protein